LKDAPKGESKVSVIKLVSKRDGEDLQQSVGQSSETILKLGESACHQLGKLWFLKGTPKGKNKVSVIKLVFKRDGEDLQQSVGQSSETILKLGESACQQLGKLWFLKDTPKGKIKYP
jgi:hypothetical protein